MPRKKNPRSFRRGASYKYVDKSGYIMIYKPDHPLASYGYVREHRLVMESHIGRYLTRKEIVHHKDGDPSNNSIDNLVLVRSQREHMQHHIIYKSDHKCVVCGCGSEKTHVFKRNGLPMWVHGKCNKCYKRMRKVFKRDAT